MIVPGLYSRVAMSTHPHTPVPFLPLRYGSDLRLGLLSSDPWLLPLRLVSVAPAPLSRSCPGSGVPAEGPPECSCPQHQESYRPQVPEVPDHTGGLQPAPGGLPWPHLLPNSCARLLRPSGGGEGPGLWAPDLSSSSLAWEKQFNSIMGPGDCLMGSI